MPVFLLRIALQFYREARVHACVRRSVLFGSVGTRGAHAAVALIAFAPIYGHAQVGDDYVALTNCNTRFGGGFLTAPPPLLNVAAQRENRPLIEHDKSCTSANKLCTHAIGRYLLINITHAYTYAYTFTNDASISCICCI